MVKYSQITARLKVVVTMNERGQHFKRNLKSCLVIAFLLAFFSLAGVEPE